MNRIPDPKNYVEYEVWNSITGKVFKTDSLEEASAYFEEGWNVSEKHITISKPFVFSSVRLEVATLWTEDNNNFDETEE